MSQYSVGDAITFRGPRGEKGLEGKITEIKPLPPVYVVEPTKPYIVREPDNYGEYIQHVEKTLTVRLSEITGKTGGRRRKTRKHTHRSRKTRRARK